jgi:2-polyprenyl-3-methyl-5-hydroxy-6-metoxy-1,4-benzoquinol methylase
MTNKVEQAHWDASYARTQPHVAPRSHVIRRWIERHVPRTESGTALEVGCYPGRFLAVLGELGYEVNGVDLTPGVESLGEWMRSRGFRTGTIARNDFFAYDPGRTFDVVMSLGFIEHFTEFERVLERHLALVAPGGMLVLQTPNLGGALHGWLYRTFDPADYARHHLPAMDPARWATVARAHAFDVVFAGCFGPFHFWINPADRPVWQRASLLGLRVASRVLRPVLPRGRPAYAPACGMIARRAPAP